MEAPDTPSPIATDEVLAITRLRQWSVDRLALRASRTTDYQRQGYRPRDARTFDARLVRVLDFERALAQLTQDEQALLVLIYRERQNFEVVSKVLSCSVRKLSYTLPPARKHLARILDRMDIL